MGIMLHFVIQEHSGFGPLHWDLMIQEKQALATWKVQKHPNTWPNQTITCQNISPHRSEYLHYEGPISNNRGQVHIVDSGTCENLKIDKNYWLIKLFGDKIKGIIELKKLKKDDWQLNFEGDISEI